MEKKKIGVFEVCAIIVTIMIVFAVGLTTAVVKKGITVKGDFGAVQTIEQDTEEITDAPTELETIVEQVTDASGEVVTDAGGEAVTEVVTKVVAQTEAVSSKNGASVKKLSTKEEILKAYTTVVDKVPNEKPAFKSQDWQEMKNISLPEDKFENLKAKAKDNSIKNLCFEDNKKTGGRDAGEFPRYFAVPDFVLDGDPADYQYKACVLTDVSKIKSAKCEVLSNGNYKITIVLIDEDNPKGQDHEKHPKESVGYTASVFQVEPFGMAASAFGLFEVGAAKKTYTTDCTAVLVYNPKNNQCVSLDHTVNYYASFNKGDIIISARYIWDGFVWSK